MLYRLSTTSLFLLSLLAFGQSWVEVKPFGGSPRDDGVAFAIGDKAYAGTGREVGFALTNDFYSYDPAIDSWSQVASLPAEPRQYCGRFTIADTGYVVCGFGSSGYLNELWAYHPETDVWSQKASFPGTPRSSPIAFSIAGKAFVGTGRNGDIYFQDMWEYDPATDEWSQFNDFPGGRRFEALGLSIGGLGYAGLGRLQDDTYADDWWQLNPESGEWIEKANFVGENRYYAVESAINGRGMVAGGQDDDLNYRNEVYSYDPIDDSWNQLPPLPFDGTKGTFAFSLNGDFYIGTGINSQNIRQNALYKIGVPASQDPAYTIYPNPFRGSFNVSSSAGRILKARIYSMHGSMIRELPVPAPTRFISVDLNPVAESIYLIELDWENGETTRRRILKINDLNE